jgi:hypothetical protein
VRQVENVIGSSWGVPATALDAVEHHWTASGPVWKSDCGKQVTTQDVCHCGVSHLEVWFETDRTQAKVCTACAAIYPTTGIGKLLDGKVVLPR